MHRIRRSDRVLCLFRWFVAICSIAIYGMIQIGCPLSGVVVECGQLIISPRLNGHHNGKYVVKHGHKFTLTCLFQQQSGADDRQPSPTLLHWTNANGDVIDGESSASVFTLGLREKLTHYHKRLLVFKSIDAERDAGTYTCESVDDNNIKTSQAVQLVVVETSQWTDGRERVGGMLAESLRIDCSASGEPQPSITITDVHGQPLADDRFVVAGHVATISELTRDDQDTVVQCLASQVFDDLHYTNVEKRLVTIDVWFAPEFVEKEINRFGIAGRNGTVVCDVSLSNPHVNQFQFFKDGVELIDDSDQHKTTLNLSIQSASLHIKKLMDDDFGEYICRVSNGKAISEQVINLKRASPPGQVRSALLSASTNAIVWKLTAIDDDNQQDLPVTELRINYVRKQLLVDEPSYPFQDLTEAREHVWNSRGRVEHLLKSDNDVYTIGGLRPGAEYVFRLQAVNAAGFGEPLEVTATTITSDPSYASAVDGGCRWLESSRVLISMVLLVLTMIIIAIEP